MSYRALLFCPEEKTARVVTQVLTELDFTVEPCNEPFAAVKKLMGEHFDAVVVDCEHEQNATLLFKSARNSGSNQSSLAVAVVEGQAGVAKAFRIGANLVLTKPINVEQSKGTLRVARGLLRKAEAGKPAAPAATEHPARPAAPSGEAMRPAPAMTAERPRFAPFTQKAPPAPAPVASTADFELEKEPEPQPEPADEALLESMQDPAPGHTEPATAAKSKEYPWQPASKHSEPMASALRRAAEAAKPKELDSPAASSRASAQGAASAPAPAKEVLRPSVSPWEPTPTAAPAPGKDDRDKPQLVIKKASAVDESAVEPPAFSALRLEDEPSEGGGSKKTLLIAAAVVLAAMAGYVGWSKMHTGSAQPAVQAPAPAVQEQAPAADGQVITMEPQTVPAGKPSPSEGKAASAQGREAVTAAPGAKTSSAPKPTITVGPEDATSHEVTVAKAQEPLVVRNDAPRPVAAPPAAPETAEPPAPGAVGGTSNTDEKALAGIVSAPAGVPAKPPQTLKISQGVSQGLLLKRVQPVYPAQALQMRVQGAVELDASISTDGSVTKIKVLRGQPSLARAAVDAVRQWKYQPYVLNGEPVAIDTQITVNFKLPQ